MHVEQLWRYPFKSMRGERLETARLGAGGVAGDRRYALVNAAFGTPRAGKHHTAEQYPRLLSYAATAADGAVLVRAPDGTSYDATDHRLRERLEAETGMRLALRDDPAGGNHDDADVLVVTEASIRELGNEWGKPVDFIRFRPNILVRGSELRAFEEEAWLGRRVKAGGALLEAVSLCVRCATTTLDPQTCESDPTFLRVVAQQHKAYFGVYYRVVEPGDVRAGDPFLPI